MPSQSQPVGPARLVPTSRPGVILAVLSGGAFMASLDVFIVNVAFPDIGHDFHGVALSNLSWILNGYTIVYTAMLVPLGRLADLGRRGRPGRRDRSARRWRARAGFLALSLPGQPASNVTSLFFAIAFGGGLLGVIL